MSVYKCLIVDDEPVAQRILERYLQHFPEYLNIASCDNAFEARDYLNNYDIDLLFLDLEMPQLKGLNFLKTLKNRPEVIIVSAYREYAVDGFDLDVLDYLLKPVSLERFIKALNKFRDVQKEESIAQPLKDHIFIFHERKSIKVKLDEIEYVEGLSNYVRIKLSNESIVVYYTMNKILETLDSRFIRVHRSYIINKNKITAFTKEHVEVQDKIIPVGKSFREKFENLDLNVL